VQNLENHSYRQLNDIKISLLVTLIP